MCVTLIADIAVYWCRQKIYYFLLFYTVLIYVVKNILCL